MLKDTAHRARHFRRILAVRIESTLIHAVPAWLHAMRLLHYPASNHSTVPAFPQHINLRLIYHTGNAGIKVVIRLCICLSTKRIFGACIDSNVIDWFKTTVFEAVVTAEICNIGIGLLVRFQRLAYVAKIGNDRQ